MTIKATFLAHMGSDLAVVNAARVSFAKESEWANQAEWLWGDDPILADNDAKLISYLSKHKHMSPFGHCFASFHVKAPIFVARQLVKHKFLRWNEVSRRYVDSEPEFYVPDEWRARAEDKKQGSKDEVIKCGDLDYECQETIEVSLYVYKYLLEMGVCPEQARMVLPQSTMTEWWWSGSLDAFAQMCALRCKPDTQKETRLVADQISSHMAEVFPVSWPALMENL